MRFLEGTPHVAVGTHEVSRVHGVELALPGLPVVLLTEDDAEQLGVALLDAYIDARQANDPTRSDPLAEARDEIRRSTR